jgi:hypothetical protein
LTFLVGYSTITLVINRVIGIHLLNKKG